MVRSLTLVAVLCGWASAAPVPKVTKIEAPALEGEWECEWAGLPAVVTLAPGGRYEFRFASSLTPPYTGRWSVTGAWRVTIDEERAAEGGPATPDDVSRGAVRTHTLVLDLDRAAVPGAGTLAPAGAGAPQPFRFVRRVPAGPPRSGTDPLRR